MWNGEEEEKKKTRDFRRATIRTWVEEKLYARVNLFILTAKRIDVHFDIYTRFYCRNDITFREFLFRYIFSLKKMVYVKKLNSTRMTYSEYIFIL